MVGRARWARRENPNGRSSVRHPYEIPFPLFLAALLLAPLPVMRSCPPDKHRAGSSPQRCSDPPPTCTTSSRKKSTRSTPRSTPSTRICTCNPELSFVEVRTAGSSRRELPFVALEVRKVGNLGVVGVLKNGAGPTVLVRTTWMVCR